MMCKAVRFVHFYTCDSLENPGIHKICLRSNFTFFKIFFSTNRCCKIRYNTYETSLWYQTNCKPVFILLMYKWPQEVVAAGVAAGLAISISVDISLWISLTPSLALDLSRFQRLGLFFSTPLLFTCCNLSLVSVNAIKPYLSGVVGWTCSPLRFSQAGLWYFVGFAPAPHIIIAPEILPRSDGIWGSNFLSFIHTYVGWRHHTAFTPSLVS